ncbi:hypothetical protein CTZ27_17975 [Streptomyces griseocarneus]|nr:hypothetical protein CTZ27_17975 [Streptomyces griseocarneus]
MPAHSIMPGRQPAAHEGPGPVARGTHLPHAARSDRWTWAVPLAGAVMLGLYGVFLASENGWPTLNYWLLGLALAVVSGVLGHALIRQRDKMITEVRAAAFGSLLGASIGFLHALTGATVLRSAQIGLLVGLGMGLTSYYVFYWHEH